MKKKITSVALITALVATSLYIPGNVVQTEASSYGLSNPTIEKNVVISGDDSEQEEGTLNNPVVKATVTTWDCIYFGNYWQNDTNGDGIVNQNDEKQPIKWRVLSVDGDDAFLFADQNLDCQSYNEEHTDVTWETCTLRSWLNSTFFTNAFSAEEQQAIQDTMVVNEGDSSFGTEGGNNTKDKIYLLSDAEANNAAYGFDCDFGTESRMREAKNSAYAMMRGSQTDTGNGYEGNGAWWLRSPGRYNYTAAYVMYNGFISQDAVSYGIISVRPVLHIDLSYSLWEEAEEKKVSQLDSSTWDSIYFGNYWQNDTNGDGVANQNDEKQPIKWRVLSVDGDDAFLLADQNLDCQPYNEEREDVTWETCTLRSWLNSTFLTNAFSTEERKAIQNTMIPNEDNPFNGTEGGNNTMDKVYLLSIAEVSNMSYGFDTVFSKESNTREAKNSVYAKACGVGTASSTEWNGHWWLRSPGYSNVETSNINYDGNGDYDGYWVNMDYFAVRPALHINLSSKLWKTEGMESVVEPPPAPSIIPPDSGSTVIPTKTPDSIVTQTPVTSKEPTDTNEAVAEVKSGVPVLGKVSIKSTKNQTGKKLVIKWKKVKNANGYQIVYSTNKKFKGKKTKKVSITTATLKKLKKRKTYYVKVRAYAKVKGKKIYGKWSTVKKVKIKK